MMKLHPNPVRVYRADYYYSMVPLLGQITIILFLLLLVFSLLVILLQSILLLLLLLLPLFLFSVGLEDRVCTWT